MECTIGDVTINYVERGEGTPVIGLHGAGVDHREIEVALEATLPHDEVRRIYPDLPGMGGSTAQNLQNNNDVVELLCTFIERLCDESVVLVGHSYGAYLARGIASRRPDLLRVLALICPIGESSGDVPEHEAVREDADAHDELDPELRKGFDDYVVVRTVATAQRYRDHVVPGTRLVDTGALERIFGGGWEIALPGAYAGPTLIVAGRRDSTVGYRDATALAERYPHATLAVADDAGHALMHERPELLAALLADLVARS